ncbi:sorting nexin C terminal-domain-containing protein [Radiomyces spectabilis]|uniref:sorting nexin C terminal-domain-containing protein n=1 Tax=Radiomyces spectabilis TaxID=64574 RepID=UPI0022201700|nr:sorting nexin C terminal-domain-containing protein [Radiomyces spectabilis]KAI8369275.1 sorting nexin C terminal-domain-containing protein [Radiomyces spectabilis]
MVLLSRWKYAYSSASSHCPVSYVFCSVPQRECRAFEDSGMSLEAYTLHNPQSPFAQMLSIEEQQQQLRGLTNTVIKRLLPPADIASPLVCILLKELLSTHLFGNILESCSDPDFINSQIIDHLSEQENTMEESMNPTLGDLDGFRSVVEKATEEAIALEDHSPSPIQELPQELPPAPHPASPPCTPRPQRSAKTNVGYTKEGTTRPSSTTATIEHTSPGSHDEVSSRPTVDTSIKTRSEEEEAAAESPMLYPRGTVLFSVMDISERRASTGLPDKNKLAFIIQIERPAMHGQPGSEGGGYVITRNYTDFEVFQSIMAAKHPKHVARLNLRLPLDASRSWLKSATTAPTNDAEAMSRSLEKYLHTVVQDSELGRDQTITAFLRKERRNDQDADSLTFADEYRDQINAYAALAEKQTHASPTSGVGRAMSLFSRGPARHQPTTTTADAGALDPLHPEDATTTTTTSTHSPTEPSKRWFKRKSTREGSISSLWSSNSSSKEDTEDEHDFKEFQESTIPEESDTSPSVSSMTTSLETLPTAATTPLKINPAIVPTPSPEAPISLEASTPADKPRKKTSLSAVDVELLIETTFALVVEIFDLTRTNNKAWMRRSLLNLLREIVRRSYTEIIAKGYDDYMNEYLSPDAIAQLIDKINDQYWPTENNDNSKKSSSSSRSIEEKEKCRRQARMMLMNRAIPGGLRQLIGDQNCSAAMDRLWRRCQNPELNRILMLQILERIMRPIFV